MIYMINYVKVNGKIYTPRYLSLLSKNRFPQNLNLNIPFSVRISFSNVIETKTKAIYGPLSLLSPLLRQQKSTKRKYYN